MRKIIDNFDFYYNRRGYGNYHAGLRFRPADSSLEPLSFGYSFRLKPNVKYFPLIMGISLPVLPYDSSFIKLGDDLFFKLRNVLPKISNFRNISDLKILIGKELRNKLDPLPKEITIEHFPIILESIKNYIHYYKDTCKIMPGSNQITRKTKNTLFKIFFCQNSTAIVGEYGANSGMIFKKNSNNSFINDSFGVSKYLNQTNAGINQTQDATPLIYLAIDKSYLHTFRGLFIIGETDKIDYSKFRLCIDNSVIEKDGENNYLKSLLKSYFYPMCEEFGITTEIVNVKRDILVSGGFGYGKDRFKKLFDKPENKGLPNKLLTRSIVSSYRQIVNTHFNTN